ncbi:MAG: hydroxymethylbilane synthase [Maricaulaceae bacterium]
MQRRFRIGTRGSPLAMWQARWAQTLLSEALGLDPEGVPITVIKTTGDAITDRRLAEAGGKGLFAKELELALLDDDIDIAVHSCKDLPTRLPAALAFAAALPRADPRDVLISKTGAQSVHDLPQGARVGTASRRREAMARRLRPDLEIDLLRGNVQTRIDKVLDGPFDATFLAAAGLKRLGHQVGAPLALADWLPAATQGIVAFEIRADDAEAQALCARVECRDTAIAAAAERGFLDALDGSCETPIGALAEIDGDHLRFRGEALSHDGAQVWARAEDRRLGAEAKAEARALGQALGKAIRAEAGEAFPLDVLSPPPRPA